MDDDDDLTEPPPSGVRLRVLIGALAVVLVAAGVCVWWIFRPIPPQPEAPPPRTNTLGADQVKAKKLPEYTELRGMINRPLTDAEITRAVELTQHPNAWIRLEARGRLSNVRDGPRRADAVNAIAAGLREETEIMRADAMHSLGLMNARECDADLRALLTSPVEEDRTCSRPALQQMGLPVD